MSVYMEWMVKPEGVHREKIEKLLETAIKAALDAEGITVPVEIGLNIVSEEEIRKLNRKLRGIDRITDVLSFPLNEYEEGKEPGKTLSEVLERGECDPDTGEVGLGDIVICFQRAEEQARAYGHSLEREMAFLSVHSVLHLLGYDHMTQDEEKVMFDKQEKVLISIGLPR